MTRTLAVISIVEGHGEVAALPILLRRIAAELLDDTHIEVPRPIRIPRGRMVQEQHLGKAVNLAVLKLANIKSSASTILVLLDADADAPCVLGPKIESMARRVRRDADVFCVVAHPEYETWFVAAAESLIEKGELCRVESEQLPADPEARRLGKLWVRRHMRNKPAGYSESLDQPKLTNKMDLHACRRRARSFDKLCRELEKRTESDSVSEAE